MVQEIGQWWWLVVGVVVEDIEQWTKCSQTGGRRSLIKRGEQPVGVAAVANGSVELL